MYDVIDSDLYVMFLMRIVYVLLVVLVRLVTYSVGRKWLGVGMVMW